MSNPQLVWLHLVKRMYDECGAMKAEEFIRRVESGEHDVTSPWSRCAHFETLDIQKRIRRWVESRLGMAAMDLHERGMRSGEEQIELGQCCGVTREEYHALVDHVFDKPVGEIRQELGGTALTLLACADGAGYVLSECAIRELERVESLPPEKFRKRQAENVVNGIGAPMRIIPDAEGSIDGEELS